MITEINSMLVVDAQVRPIESEEEFETVTASIAALPEKLTTPELAEHLSLAAPAPIIDGKPRMLHLTAFIVHEGVNRNGDRFIGEELRVAVNESKLFAEGYAGIIDIEHDFMPVGYWYDSEFVTDPATNTRAILAHGAIWAFLNPEVADQILAQQHRDGFVRVSMACISKTEDVDFDVDEETGRMIKTMHNPVFLGATVLLDSPAGDKDAKGIAEEDPNVPSKSDRKMLVMSSASEGGNHNKNLEDRAMIEEIKPLLAELLGDQKEEFLDAISNLVQEKVDSFNSLLAEKDDALNEVNSQIETLNTEIADLKTQLEEKDLAIETLNTEKEGLVTKLDETQASLDGFIAAKDAQEFEDKKNSRLAELSEVAKSRLMAKEEEIRNAILDRWAKQSDEEWETTKAELSLTKEGLVVKPLPGVGTEGQKTIDDFLLQ